MEQKIINLISSQQEANWVKYRFGFTAIQMAGWIGEKRIQKMRSCLNKMVNDGVHVSRRSKGRYYAMKPPVPQYASAEQLANYLHRWIELARINRNDDMKLLVEFKANGVFVVSVLRNYSTIASGKNLSPSSKIPISDLDTFTKWLESVFAPPPVLSIPEIPSMFIYTRN